MRAFLLVLFLSNFARAALNAPACRFAIDVPGVWRGELVESLSNEAVEVFELGGGMGGAIVYRHIPRDGSPSYIVKEYQSLVEAKKDHHNLQLLEQAISASRDGGKNIRVVKVLKAEKRTLWLEDVRGTNIEKLYNETSEKRNFYWDKLWTGLNMIVASLADFSRQPAQFDRWQFEPSGEIPRPDDMRNWKQDERPDRPARALPELLVHYEERHPGSRRWIRRQILVHPQNIILEPDGMMVIIDPG